MDLQQRQQLSHVLSRILLFIWGITFLLFPLSATLYTTDQFILPKEILLAGAVLVSFLLWGVKMLLDKQVRIRRTPFDIPVALFAAAVVLSSLFAVNRVDSILASVPFLFALLSYFVVVTVAREENAFLFLSLCLVCGGVLSGIITSLSHAKIYLLPFSSTHTTTFSTFGSYYDMACYLIFLLPVILSFVTPAIKRKVTSREVTFGVLGLFLLFALVTTGQALFTSQKPILLPFETGFQTAFAAISQDAGRVAQGFFFGSGYGNYATVFTRFKPVSFNTNPNWFVAFSSSSSYLLELLATTGIIGTLSFIFLLLRICLPVSKKTKNPLYCSLLILLLTSIILPFSYVEVALFFFLLSLFALYQLPHQPSEYFDVELRFVALKKGVLNFAMVDEEAHHRSSPLTHWIAFVILLAIVVAGGFYTTSYVLSDITFQESLVAAQQNSGTLTYKYQTQAITTFPYRSVYYRVFSQTNIALANSLLSLQNGASPSAQVQQTALTLIQQSITAAKTATTLSPEDVLVWQNLASVYRALIGLGQNADTFAIQASQQAVSLDPTNPQEYLALGGIYYQLGQYDAAIQQFTTSASLKQNYANAYYNLAHSYEQKNDTQNALAALQIVKQLVVNDSANEQKVGDEITALQSKGTNSQQTSPSPTSPSASQLQVEQGPSPLPAQPTKIPLVSPTPTK